MSELIVVTYDNAARAEEVREKLLDLQRDYLVDLNDAVVASLDAKGRVKLNQLVNMWAPGASFGSFWGFLVGILFMHPIFGVVAGAAAGAVGGALSDYGINDRFMRRIAASMQEGRAALFIMARKATGERVIEALAEYGGELMRTNLDPSQEEKLRKAFAEAHAAEAA